MGKSETFVAAAWSSSVKPGDLVTLRGRIHYTGLDMSDSCFIDVPGEAIGVYMGLTTDREYNIYDLVLTGGKLVKCARKVWSVLDETR
jgi:hypothetical protein